MSAVAWDFAPDRTGPPPDRTRRPSLFRSNFPDAESGNRMTALPANAFIKSPRPAVRRLLNMPFGGGNVAQFNMPLGTFYSGNGILPQASIDEATFATAVCRPSTTAYISGASLSGGTVGQASFDVAVCNTVSGTFQGGTTAGGAPPQLSLEETVFTTAVCRPSTMAYRPLFSGEMVQQAGFNVNTCGTAFGTFNLGTTQATTNAVTLNESALVDPGRQAIDLSPSLSRCLLAVYDRQMVLSETQAAALKRQLRVLLEDEEELQSANIRVSTPSLHRLIDFLSEHQRSPLPSLSITRAGYFAASWSPRKRAKLTIVFRPEGVADWIASDLNATPPVHQKDTLANRLGEFAAWANA
jgi:hypothetical protein